jgi:uncharacterized protein YodC (DUF2158 family)
VPIEEPSKQGDVVQLKSGGPSMTAVSLDSRGVKCAWFDEDDHPDRDFFPRKALKHYKPTRPGPQ